MFLISKNSLFAIYFFITIILAKVISFFFNNFIDLIDIVDLIFILINFFIIKIKINI